MGKKIISYSLYNGRPKDTINAIINCILIPTIYPGWIPRFYVDETLPSGILKLLKTFDYVEIINMPKHRGSEAMLWRFLPASDPDVDVMISRDADSWVSVREAVCVEQWLNSDKNFHIIRDHCYHSQRIMGGVWGIRNHIISDMNDRVDKFSKNQTYDQGFLADEIYPLIIDTLFVHYGSPQFNNKGTETHGYFDDGGVPIPEYNDPENIENFLFKEVHKLNEFKCAHCNKIHETYIGAISEHIPPTALNVVRERALLNNISLEECPGL